MANSLYDLGREKFLGPGTGQINWTNDTIKTVLVSGSYSPNIASHEFVTAIHAHTGTVTAQTLITKTVTAGVADAADVLFLTVLNNMVVKYAVIFKDTGIAETSPLIAFIDTATGLPLTASGANISITFDSGPNKIFKL